ncbi:hypothetical protein QYF36_010088 [Acer negundo]|nr:hypothetical protein QYF36_010088 [Acer negundo]
MKRDKKDNVLFDSKVGVQLKERDVLTERRFVSDTKEGGQLKERDTLIERMEVDGEKRTLDSGLINEESRSPYEDSRIGNEREGKEVLSGEHQSRLEALVPVLAKNRRGSKCNHFLKSHGMKTKSSKSSMTFQNSGACDIGREQDIEVNIKELWNIEEEIAKDKKPLISSYLECWGWLVELANLGSVSNGDNFEWGDS